MKACPTEEILQTYLDGELPAHVRENVRAHLVTCEFCTDAAVEIEQAFAAMRSALALPDTIPTARLRARIESELAEKPTPGFVWAQWFWRWGWAAAIFLVAGIVSWTLLGKHSTPQLQQAENKRPATANTAEPSMLLPEVTLKSEIAQPPQRPHHRMRRQVRHHSTVAVEAVTEFYPLREGEDLSALDTMQLVRVELPRSALGEIGLPIEIEVAHRSIKADVILGDDGLARAIRFVR